MPHQYRDRDHREPLFAFKKRALVHFAVDTDECYMTTADESVRDAGEANTIDNFAHIFDRKLEEIVIGRMDRNSDQVVRFLDNPEVRELVTRLMRNQVYIRIQQDARSRATEA